jgi:hypothetical protein
MLDAGLEIAAIYDDATRTIYRPINRAGTRRARQQTKGYLSYGRVCFPDRPQFPRQTHDQQKSRGWDEQHCRPEAKIVIE